MNPPKSQPVLSVVENTDYFDFFAARLIEYIPAGGKVLDIGAGAQLHDAVRRIRSHFGTLVGVDPDPEVSGNPSLSMYYNCTIESAPLEPGSFDGAFAVYVAEHILAPGPFLHTVSRLLRPGAWFWVLTPNAMHPFALLSRSAELVGLKDWFRGHLKTPGGVDVVNDYPAYYHLNHPYKLNKYRGKLFDRATGFLLSAGWDGYFPTRLKWIPQGLNRLLSSSSTGNTILLFGLRRASDVVFR